MTVLVVAAHLDDEILGAGGTLRRHVLEGDRVAALVACCGSNLRYGAEEDRRLREASRAAAAALGFSEIRHADLPDQGLDTLSLVEVIEPVRKALDDLRPEVIYTHDASDINRDHRILLEAVAVAARPYAAPWLQRFACFETPSSTEWGSAGGLPPFEPNLFVEITATLEAKIAAFARYESEVRPYPHPRALDALRERARYWGSLAGYPAAEPFRIVRERRGGA